LFARTVVLVRNSVDVIVHVVLLNIVLYLVVIVTHTLCFLMSPNPIGLLFVGLKTVTILSAMVRIDIYVQFGITRLDLQTILSAALDKLLARWSIHDRKR